MIYKNFIHLCYYITWSCAVALGTVALGTVEVRAEQANAETHQVVIPHFLDGLSGAPRKISFKGRKDAVAIVQGNDETLKKIQQKSLTTVDTFFQALMYCYQKDLRKSFYKLLDTAAHKSVKQMSKADFDLEWQTMGKFSKKNPRVLYYWHFRDGIIASWKADDMAMGRQLFLKKGAGSGSYVISDLNVGVKDSDYDDFHDLGLYFNYAPLTYGQPQILESFKEIDLTKSSSASSAPLKLSLKLKNPKSQLVHIFKKDGNTWKLAARVKDNDIHNYLLPDHSHEKGRIDLKFKPAHFTTSKPVHNLLILETNFPMVDVDLDLLKKDHVENSEAFESNWTIKNVTKMEKNE